MEQVARRHDSRRAEKGTVLVVEDHDAIQHLLRVVFEQRGFTCVGVGTVDEALARVREGGVNAVVTDWTVPEGGGERIILELLRDEATRSLPVIVTSGANLPDLSYYPNVAAVVAKPFDLDALCSTLDEYC